MKKKILLIFAIILVIILIVIGILYFNGKRKVDIMSNLSNKITEIKNKDNIYIKSNSDSLGYYETYKLNDTIKQVIYYKYTQEKYVFLITPNNTIKYIISDDGTKKIMTIDETNDIQSYMEFETLNKNNWSANFFETIKYGMNIKISTEEIKNKECYVIEHEGDVVYVDKETGLPYKTIQKMKYNDDYEIKYSTTYEYKIDGVKESDVAELDRSEFTLLSESEFNNYYTTQN